MHQTEPQNPLPLVFKITDPYDTNTYYVRAVIRDSLAGTILQTVNLTDQGGGRFTSQINAPADITGLGRHIDITKTVYTDSGYTTKSDSYREEVDYWYIKSAGLGGNGGWGGGEDIDYELIRKIINEILDQKLAPLENSLLNQNDLNQLITSQREILYSIKAIELSEAEREDVDLKPVLTMIQSRSDAILERLNKLPQKAISDTELVPIFGTLADILDLVGKLPEDIKEDKKTTMQEMIVSMETTIKSILDQNYRLKQILKEITSGSNQDDTEIKLLKDKIETPKENIISPYLKRK